MVIGFIGLGNMAGAIIEGVLKSQQVNASDIIGSAATQKTLDNAANRYGIRTTLSNSETAREADVIVIAVKPNIVPIVLEDIKEVVDEHKLLISIAAGKTTKWITDYLQKPVKVIRVLPNTPALVQAGASGICRNENVTDDDLRIAQGIFGSVGMTEVVSETLADAIGTVGGCTPAYVFMFIEALADAGVKWGMPRKQAYRFAAQAVYGSAQLMLQTGRNPSELKDMVCSPGGTTIEGLEALEQDGFRGAVMDAIDAAMEKTRKL